MFGGRIPRGRVTLVDIRNTHLFRFQKSAERSTNFCLLTLLSRGESWKPNHDPINATLIDECHHAIQQNFERRVFDRIERERDPRRIIKVGNAGATGADIESKSAHTL